MSDKTPPPEPAESMAETQPAGLPPKQDKPKGLRIPPEEKGAEKETEASVARAAEAAQQTPRPAPQRKRTVRLDFLAKLRIAADGVTNSIAPSGLVITPAGVEVTARLRSLRDFARAFADVIEHGHPVKEIDLVYALELCSEVTNAEAWLRNNSVLGNAPGSVRLDSSLVALAIEYVPAAVRKIQEGHEVERGTVEHSISGMDLVDAAIRGVQRPDLVAKHTVKLARNIAKDRFDKLLGRGKK